MRIIGIDPGTLITGIGIIECSGNAVEVIDYDTINSTSRESLPMRLKKIYDSCLLKIQKFSPDEFAIETAFYGKNIQSTLKLGQARGVAIIAAANSKLNICEYSPRKIKKAVTGSGASSKEQVRYMVMKILSIKKNPAFIDSTDALAVALCHHYCRQNPFNGVSAPRKPGGRKSDWKKFIENFPEKVLTVN